MGTDVSDFKRTYREATEGEFPYQLTIELQREAPLRYGENPNQPAAVYSFKGSSLAEFTNIHLAKSGKGGLSATNFMDVTRAMGFLKFFDMPAVAVMKHLIPSGFARQHEGNDQAAQYLLARDADARSAFGSVAVFNRPVEKATAEALMSTYVEGVAAPDFEEGALGILERKNDLRVIFFSNLDRLPRFTGDDVGGLYDLKVLPTGRVVVQAPYLSSIRGVQDLILDPMVKHEGKDYEVQHPPTEQEIEDMVTAWHINIGVRSNGIVLVKDGVTLAVGSGQQERVGAVEQAIVKAYQKAMDRRGIKYDFRKGTLDAFALSAHPLAGSVCSSDAFFPFRDSIDCLANARVAAVIQPGGSVRDYEVIQAANEYKMAMAFTLERCFGHF